MVPENGPRRSPPESDTLIVDIVTTVAADVGCEPQELTPPFGSVVDPDALVALVEGSGTPVEVAFEYHGRRVEIGADGSVDVSDPAGER